MKKLMFFMVMLNILYFQSDLQGMLEVNSKIGSPSKSYFMKEKLVSAASKGKLKEVKKLLAEKEVKQLLVAKVENLNEALLAAARAGHVNCVEVLISAGANPNDKEYYSMTPLHAAAENDHVACVQFLLKNGAYHSPIGYGDCTPLHLAASNSQFRSVEALLAGGADLTMVDLCHHSPLAKAVSVECLQSTKFLLQAGANPLDQIYGKSLVDFVRERLEKHRRCNVMSLNFRNKRNSSKLIKLLEDYQSH